MPVIPATVRQSPWVDKQITVTHEDLTQTKTDAKVLGAFAVHKAVDEDRAKEGWFMLTHVPTGLFVVSLQSEHEVMTAGEWLWTNLCMTFRSKSQQEIKDKTKSWAKPWRDSCIEAGKFLVPDPS